MILLDTNVLIYALHQYAPQHEASRSMVDAAIKKEVPVVLTAQVLVEVYAILTDRRRVKKPLDAQTAWAQIQAYRALLPLLPWSDDVLMELGRLVLEHRFVGQKIFDAVLVAQMRVHGIAVLCTYNAKDFSHFAGIEVSTPEDLLSRFRI